MGKSSSEKLPTDIVFDIISRTTSLQTLDTCKSVCKEWKQLIYESSFMPLYCQNTNNLYGYFVQDVRKSNYVSMFVCLDNNNNNKLPFLRLPENTRILASCNQGILCCLKKRNSNDYQYCVCKPATQQWQDLPKPRLDDCTTTVSMAIMVLGSTPLRYKIVRLSRDGSIKESEYCTYYCEIFDSETRAWRKIQDVNLPYPELIRDSAQPVLINNSIHWLTNDNNILKFNLVQESFHIFTLPEHLHNTDNNRLSNKLVEYEGRLGLVCTTQEEDSNNNVNMELWLTDEDNESKINWRTNCKKVLINDMVERYANPAGIYNAGILFLKAADEVVFYKIQDRSLINKVKLDRLRDAREVFQFRSDFERVDFGRVN
ncbi:hypothetical protein ABFS82_05G125100 [Erythranthe guttata]|uniref:F-box associated beta-propeller type 1 domain-containing protein n=1 Tax=Erythranthe guttata TaxID=4155 RepID=A0A022QKF7_ERYGU|nr:PREDICTED: F-box protein At5g49610-like [Erythranthe guttata]EYU29202.1 hypothetical protein MIMGU_mgv1a019286mg [Erythranthe guttata]|eukprot:XP_012847023.1 PREDICTED: F-box protein At5g49610-like [Erythranthe guttata]